MKFVAIFLLVLSLPQTYASAQQQVEFTGKLEAELVPDNARSAFAYKAASEEEKAELPVPLVKADQAFVGSIYWRPKREDALKAILIEPAEGAPFLYADTNVNGKLEANERYLFSSVENDSAIESEIMLKIPLANSSYKHYPVLMRRYKAGEGPAKEGSRYLVQNFGAFARGVVEINGNKTQVQFSFDVEAGKVNPSKGYLGIDGDGDGKIDMGFTSPEAAYAEDETVVFRVGDNYVSTKAINNETGEVVLKSHPATDYQRIELRIGAEVPDFSFTDFEGKSRKLSEFRGKYVLLDFWGSWCGPCVADIPHLKEAYEKFRSRRFEILGMDEDKDLEKIKKFVAEKGMIWTQATTESISELAKKRFRITAYPTLVLLDPNGKIISLSRKDQLPLRGEKLLETLDKVLPVSL